MKITRKRIFPPLHVGQKIYEWEILEIAGREVTAKCSCGRIKTFDAYVIKGGQSQRCRDCYKSAQLGNSLKNVGHYTPTRMRLALQRLSPEQSRYAVALLRSRRTMEGEEGFKRHDLIEAIEMALLTPPDRIEHELECLNPTIASQNSQHYGVYDSPRKDY